MIELNEHQKGELAYLIGAVIGDGCYTTPTEKYGSRFMFSSSDKEFVLKIKDIIENIFSLSLNISVERLSLKNKNWRDHYDIKSRPLTRSLKLYLPDKNNIPSFIRDSNKIIKARFLSGFFDAEGGICISTIKSRNALDRRAYCHNSNLELLKEIKIYLKELDIDSFMIS